ncbi:MULTISPECIES: lecithin retinol acyltransferase family protein [unclassified Shewanella]|uniref:lecithin retinol acyltransferase family protein n=1 Tax=Shewanella TaxID=22 RepID=UPI0021D9395A|nr:MULTISPECIES: lecithin retinol acyltransferase family protein [unclassified Shewanella]MCU8044369.1 lecithin retinol acyltransferase family protein [Shewanella sp. SM68]MCU8048451.1 lecithin retinol acyltransferase family protein [Shewanella sp. SM65]
MGKGDHLISKRTSMELGGLSIRLYDHHGLCIGDDKVIHYLGFSEFLKSGMIEVTTIEEFTQGNGYLVVDKKPHIFDVDVRVERAFSRLNENRYNLLFNNCEHFVSWCCYGEASSEQVKIASLNAISLASTPTLPLVGLKFLAIPWPVTIISGIGMYLISLQKNDDSNNDNNA